MLFCTLPPIRCHRTSSPRGLSRQNVLLLAAVAILLRAECHRRVELRLTAFYTAAAGALQAQALFDARTEAEATAQAGVDEAEAAWLQETAEALKSDARYSAAQSTTLEGQAAKLEASVVGNEEGALQHAAQAAVDGGISRDAAVASVEEGEAALASTVRAHETEAGVAFCQLLPGIDVLCDTLGGLTAVGFEAAATSEAAESFVDLGVAAAAKGREEREASLAAELEAQAVSEQAAADADHEEATALAEQAESERVEAEADQVAAREKLDQAVVERETAAVAATEVTRDEAQAGAATQQALQHGVRAVGWTILQVSFAVLGLTYLALQTTVSLFGSICRSGASASIPVGQSLKRFLPWSGWFVTLCFNSVYLLWVARLALSATEASSSEALDFEISPEDPTSDALSMRRRGAVVLRLALAATALQVILLHAPRWWYQFVSCRILPLSQPWLLAARFFSELFLVLGWTTFAAVLFLQQSNEPEQSEPEIDNHLAAIGAIGLATIVGHHWLFWKQHPMAAPVSVEPKEEKLHPVVVDEAVLTEAAPLLVTRLREDPSHPVCKTCTMVVWTSHHQRLLDLLIAAVFSSLLYCTVVPMASLRPFWRPALHSLVAPMLHRQGR